MQGPHRRLRTIDIAGGGAPERHKTAGEGTGGARWGKCNGHRPLLDDGRGNRPPPPSDAAGQSVDVSVYQVVGFFDVAAHLCAGDGPIAELVIVSGRVQL